ncbi:hypothetical protein ABZ477_13175 [Microbacterium sp. NPDC019599]|uniref:DUF7882 family protein n=1 Tax=Microbacterium sp. NPDC019599 TaxID=3154690 RepID=UPI003407AF91
MGRLYYGSSTEPIEMPDRLMAHLKLVASSKLRRSESFTLTCKDSTIPGAGRETIWVHCSIPLRFVFDSAENVNLDRAYLEELARAATSTVGIVIDMADWIEARPEPVLVRAA